MLAIALALGASLCWGTADFLGGLQARRLGVLWVIAGVQLIPLAGLAVAVAVAAPPLPGARVVLVSLVAGVLGLIGLTALYRALALGPMSLVAPISASGAGLPVVVGVLAGDRPSAAQAVGLVVTVAAVALAARGVDDDSGARGRRAAGVPLAVLAAVGIGGFLLAAHPAARGGVLWFMLLSRSTVLPALALALLAGSLPARPRLARLGAVVPVAALDAAATGLLALANREGIVSVVSVLASLYPVMTILLARLLLGERLRPAQAVGVAGALAGIALISAG